jgi:hypothetical protein
VQAANLKNSKQAKLLYLNDDEQVNKGNCC